MATLLVAALVASSATEVPAAGEETYQATLEYAVDPGAYDNAVRAANLTAMQYPRIVVDRNGTSPFAGTVYLLGLVGVANGSCASLAVVRSADGGRTFDTPHVSDLCLAGLSVDPVVAANGTLYAAAWGPRILLSADGGLTWQTLATLGDANSPASLTVDATTGALFVAWQGAGWTEAGNVSVSSSRDGGATWSSPTRVLPSGVLGMSPQVAARGTSVVVVTVVSNATGSLVAAVASQDGGTAWSEPDALTSNEYCMQFSAPSVAASPSGVFAVSWYADPAETGTGCWDTLGATTRAWVSVSLDGGVSFQTPQPAGGPPVWPTMSFGDAVAFDDASRLYVTWHSVDASWNGTVYVANSTDRAERFESANFSTNLQVSGGNSTAQENLAAGLNGTVFLAWVAFGPPGDPLGAGSGVFVRAIAGEAEGSVSLDAALANATVDVSLRDNRTGALGAHLRWTGGAVTVQGLPPSLYDVSVEINATAVPAGSIPVRTWGRTIFAVRVNVTGGHVEPPPHEPPSWPMEAVLAAIGVGLLASGVVLATLLHTRIAREDALQRRVRQLMFEYIRDHPGASFSQVRDGLGLQNGAASYHLRVLEKLGLIHSEAKRRHRWYYPNGDVSLWRELPLSPLQTSIVEAVRKDPGIGVRELARRVDHRASSVGYSVKALTRDGVLRTDRVNRRLRCFPGDEHPAS